MSNMPSSAKIEMLESGGKPTRSGTSRASGEGVLRTHRMVGSLRQGPGTRQEGPGEVGRWRGRGHDVSMGWRVMDVKAQQPGDSREVFFPDPLKI